MKRIAKAFVIGSLIVATQAAVAGDSSFPQLGDEYSNYLNRSVSDTYADRHANDPVTDTGSPFPAWSDEYQTLTPSETYADRHANDPVTVTGSPFPVWSQGPAVDTYADRNANDPVTSVDTSSPTSGDE